MKIVLSIIFFSTFFLSNIFLAPIVRQVPLNLQGDVFWNIEELDAKNYEMVKLIADKYRIFKIKIKNNLEKDILVSLSNYFHSFCKSNLLKNNILSTYSYIPGKTILRKFIFNGPFWVNLFMLAVVANMMVKRGASDLGWGIYMVYLFSSFGVTILWSFLGWVFCLSKYNKLNKQYKQLDACEIKISLPRRFFKNVKSQIVGDLLVIPGKSEVIDYLFLPIEFPINFYDLVLTYSIS